MTYNASIPQSTDFISNSQLQILGNFSQLNAQFLVDHTAFNTGSGNGDGFHKKVTLNVPLGADPVPAGTASAVYSKDVGGVGQLFFANSSAPKQITGTVSAIANGTSFLPGGVILKWGLASQFLVHIPFTPAFPTACFSVVLTATDPAYTGNLLVTSIDPGFFVAQRSGTGAMGYYYIAIGH